jgi:DNA end-binding protein Ku
VAKKLVESMTTKWKPSEYEDKYKLTLEKWIDEKIHHQGKRSTKKEKGHVVKKTNVVDFYELLKKSLKGKEGSGTRKGKVSKHKKAHSHRSALRK